MALALAIVASACSHTGTAAVRDSGPNKLPVVEVPGPDPEKFPGGRALLKGLQFAPLAPQPSVDDIRRDFPETTIDRTISDFTDPQIKVGQYGDRTAKKTIALTGGSHSEMWISALDILGKRYGFRVDTYLKMGCPLSTDPHPVQTNGQPYPQCFDWSMRVLERLKTDKPYAVFTTSTRPVPANGPGDWTPPTYVDVFDQLIAAGIKIYGVRDSPWPRDAAGVNFITPDCLRAGGDANTCGSSRAVVLAPVNPAIQVAASRPMFRSLDLTSAFCTVDVCPGVVGNVIVYKDWHHVSATFIRSMIDELGEQMGLPGSLRKGAN